MGNCFTCLRTVQETSGTGSNTVGGNTVIGNEHENHQLLVSNNQEAQKGDGEPKQNNSVKKSMFNGSASGIQEVPQLKPKDTQISDNAINKLFEEYKDPAEDAVLSDGIERLCCDLGYKPDDFAILVLAWRLDAAQMCCFTKAEFIQGLQQMNASTIDEIKLRLRQTIEKLAAESELFKQLYRFTFRFGLEPNHRILTHDMAISLWRLVFTVHTPDILDRWLNFLDQNPTIRGIPKDTWNMFLNFAESCDITQYDADEAWPSLFDDFVEYENDRLNQNLAPTENKDSNGADL